MKQGICIVVVDDDPACAFLTAALTVDYLEERGLDSTQVSYFSSSVQALSFIARNVLSGSVIDVLITDLQMPEMDGEELIMQTRHLSSNTSFIMMSGRHGYRPPDALGEVDFLEKPFQEEALTGLLDDALESVVSNIADTDDILEE